MQAGTQSQFLVPGINRWLCFRFLSAQNQLKLFDMSDGHLRVLEGLAVLEALGRGAGESLRMLNIEDFFQVGSDVIITALTSLRSDVKSLVMR